MLRERIELRMTVGKSRDQRSSSDVYIYLTSRKLKLGAHSQYDYVD